MSTHEYVTRVLMARVSYSCTHGYTTHEYASIAYSCVLMSMQSFLLMCTHEYVTRVLMARVSYSCVLMGTLPMRFD